MVKYYYTRLEQIGIINFMLSIFLSSFVFLDKDLIIILMLPVYEIITLCLLGSVLLANNIIIIRMLIEAYDPELIFYI